MDGGEKMILKGKIALVTGGSAGIGKAIVQNYLQEGAVVIATGRKQEKLDELKTQMAAHKQLFTVSSDISSREDNSNLLSLIAKQFGRLDILVNNAGITDQMQPVGDVADREWDEMLAINLTGPFLLCRGAVKMMLTEENRGSIINVASGGGIGGGGEQVLLMWHQNSVWWV